MTIRYCGPGGNDGNSGLTWVLRKLTLNGVEDTPVVAGDICYIGPGVYREVLTCDVSGGAGNPIVYIGDITGENTDGIGGIVRITGAAANDQVAARASVIVLGARNYRTFRGFALDTATTYIVNTEWAAGDHLIMEDCAIQNGAGIALANWGGGLNWTIRRCAFLGSYNPHIYIMDVATVDNSGHLIENCIFLGTGNWAGQISIERMGDGIIRNCLFLYAKAWAVGTAISPNAGHEWDVNNCIFMACNVALTTAWPWGILEDFNTFYGNATDRVNVAVGANSVAYPPLLQPPLLYAGAGLASGFKFPWWFGELSEWSQVAAITGANERTEDMRGIARPVTPAKNSWGAIQYTDVERDAGTVYAGVASMEISDAGRIQFKVPCTNRAYMVRVRVQREANYAGVNPQIIIKQPGQADRTTTDAGAAAAWNLLEDTFTPAADPEYFFVELVSNNTAAAGNYATYFDNLEIRGELQDTGKFEHWMWDRQPFDTLPASSALVTRGVEYRRRRVPGEVSALAEYE